MRYFIKIAYNGEKFNGWQIQKNSISIEETIENKISILLKKKINIIGGSRTDKGVHAKQMFAHLDVKNKIDKNFKKKLNNFLPSSIKIFCFFRVKDNIHARYDAISRTYKYIISIGKNIFYKNLCWIIKKKINIKKMNNAAKILINQKDFSNFCKSKKETKNYMCNIKEIHWKKKKNFLIFTIKSNRFLRNMVRFLVSTFIDIGTNKINIDDFIKMINDKNYKLPKNSAPAKGLFLSKIEYPNNIYF